MADESEPIEGVIVPRDAGELDIRAHDARQNRHDQTGQRAQYKFDAVKKNAYVALIRRGMRRVRSAEYVGVSYNTVVRAMERDEEFAAAVSEAEMARVDEVEEALYREAINGGNVTAQQVILYNRRSDEWADQRQIKARLEAAKAEAEAREERDEHSALDGLRSKLAELRERITVPATGPAEPEPVNVDMDDEEAS